MRYAVIPAAGQGKRFGKKKQFVKVNGKAIIEYTLEVFEKSSLIDKIVIVSPKDSINEMENTVSQFSKVLDVVVGGHERQASVFNALKKIKTFSNCTEVIVHDGVRPLVNNRLISNVVEAYYDYNVDGVITAVKPKDTVKLKGASLEAGDFLIRKTIDRDRLLLVQTPQLFNFEILFECHEKAVKDEFWGTDDASLLEKYGFTVVAVKGDYKNIKITTPEDLEIFKVFKHL